MTPVKAQHVDAPHIDEFPVSFECKVLSITEIGKHMHVVGEIVNVIADEAVLNGCRKH